MTRLRFSLVAVVALHAAPAQARITKGPWVQRVGTTSAVVRVEVDPPSAASLEVNAGADGGAARTMQDADVKALHAFALDALAPATRYTYSVHAGDASKLASFTTAPPDDTTTPFRFLVYGDNRTDDAAHAGVVRAMVASPADLLIHTGDFVENGGSLPQWQRFFEIEAPLLEARVLVSAVGNHELVDGSGVSYVKFFGPPNGERVAKPEHLNHTFRWGSTRFFLLNGLDHFKPASAERSWLEKVLSDADGEKGLTWRVVVVHHGPWSSGPHGGNPRLHERGVPALFKRHGVDLVLSGHDHVYERGLGAGLPFVVSGGGGAPLYKLRARIPESRKSETVHHFVEADVGPRVMQLTALRADGSRIERCALSKDAEGWFCGDLAATPPDGGAPALGEPEKAPAPGAAPSPRCSCRAAGDARGAGAAFPWALALVAYAVRRRRY
ncbi:MAG: metallophosphoesterase [Labilithrix sp.]|nr:metallophosphoesterase [Labilithrix sp.]MCW5809805.1 metallophosphoesterase [Labilithrix sp.]